MSKAVSKHGYSLLSPDRIRLLHLLPNEDERAAIQCELFEYPLQEPGKGTHLYEALSYVWGGLDNPQSISIGGNDLPVTANLHAALSRLRDRYIVRTLWVDAVCINQANEEEKGHQIQSMAQIYGQASRVIVWLGEAADNSDRAVEGIRLTAGKRSTKSSNGKPIREAILALLQRPWFRRIWVLQEVAAARHILIVCGSMEIDGFAFCLGVDLLKVFYEHLPDLQGLIRSVTYLIRGAIFRPKYATSRSGTASLDICPLGELIDMYHTHEATLRHDKVYALLGMSADNLGWSPEYGVPWEELLERLVKFLLSEKASVETQGDRREMAVIKSKGCILGQVSSVKGDSTRYDSQDVNVVFIDTPISLKYKKECGTRWTLQASAKPIWKGDLVCLLEGASKPTIIRPCKDHFSIIMIAVTLQRYVRESRHVKHQELLALTKRFSRNFLLVWNWEKSLGNLQDHARYETSPEINTLVPEYLKTASNKAARLCDMVQVLVELKEYEEAEKRLQKVREDFEGAFEKEDLHVLLYKNGQQLEKAEDLFLQVIQIRNHAQGRDHQDTLGCMASLASIYLDQVKDQEMATSLTDRIRDNVQITEEEMVWVTRIFGKKMISLLLELKSDNVPITEKVVEAAARNEESSKEVMALLLNRRNTEVKITEEIVKAAAGNYFSGREVMALLFDQCGTEVKITEEVVKVAARNRNNREVVMTLLLNQRNIEVNITEEVLKEAASNESIGYEMLQLFRQIIDIKVTVGVIEAAAASGQGRILNLFDQWDSISSDKQQWFNISHFYNAAKNGNAASVHQLLTDGTPPDKQNIYGITPLLKASEFGHKEVVEDLLATGAVDVNVQCLAGQTPLFHAVVRGSPQIVQLLLDHGAVSNYADKDGRSPLSMAQRYNWLTITAMLTKHETTTIRHGSKEGKHQN